MPTLCCRVSAQAGALAAMAAPAGVNIAGGVGTFDGILLTGILAVYLA
jgi:uncharacterized membrane protein